jgi:glucose-1-phosphate cytidylyltransferase
MKIVILAGGLGTRISEETDTKPKPMVSIGGRPIIWHLALGYKGEVIKNWLHDLLILGGDMNFNFVDNSVKTITQKKTNNWNVTTMETGLNSLTGGRIRKVMQAFPNERVLVTYGDGLANVDISSLIDFHNTSGTLATVTAVTPPPRFGDLTINDGVVVNFGEKRQDETHWVNGGWFILEPKVADYIFSDDESFEFDALPRIVSENQLSAFKHHGFWQPMDTVRERIILEELSKQAVPPWKL